MDGRSGFFKVFVSYQGVSTKFTKVSLHYTLLRVISLGVVLHVLVMGIVCNSMLTATEGRRKAAPGVYCMGICVIFENSWKLCHLWLSLLHYLL